MTKSSEAIEQIAAEITKAAADRRNLIWAGWVEYQAAVVPKDAPPVQLRGNLIAFYAGAAHLFSSIMTMLDEGIEPTDTEMARMDGIAQELENFSALFKGKVAQQPAEPAKQPAQPASQPEQLGDAPIEDDKREKMQGLAVFLDKYFNGDREGLARTIGFVLMAFDFGTPARMNYISNTSRKDVVVALREQLAHFEGMPEAQGHG